MQFRPCIDIHNGAVKQIVGGSLTDVADAAKENFVAHENADYFAKLYKEAGITGGHIILLNHKDSEYFEKTKAQAMLALKAYPGGMQIGGGINDCNAAEYIAAGASHVIVTSFVFYQGKIDYNRLNSLVQAVGKEHIVLDLSCKRVGDDYFVVTDRWQNMTEEKVTPKLLSSLETYCDEFLIHAVDVEGKCNGIEQKLLQQIGDYEGNDITYAGGVSSFEDLEILKRLGHDRVHVTIGSALNLFGGKLDYLDVLAYCQK